LLVVVTRATDLSIMGCHGIMLVRFEGRQDPKVLKDLKAQLDLRVTQDLKAQLDLQDLKAPKATTENQDPLGLPDLKAQ
jgi:hypothetical protein